MRDELCNMQLPGSYTFGYALKVNRKVSGNARRFVQLSRKSVTETPFDNENWFGFRVVERLVNIETRLTLEWQMPKRSRLTLHRICDIVLGELAHDSSIMCYCARTTLHDACDFLNTSSESRRCSYKLM